MLQLGEELTVLNVVGEVDGARHLGADEAARSRRIGERLQRIGGGDERGVAAVLLVCLAVGWAELQVGC